MTQEKILEGNKLIAGFMGAEWVQDDYKEWGYKIETPHWNKLQKPEALQYHSSWDWLMPVLEKIHLKREVKEISISMGRTRIWFSDEVRKSFIQSPCLPENNSITECWLAVIDFINWYNLHNPSTPTNDKGATI